ncbi:hypothetical protein [Geodermatophilus nigrescens]|uniref:Uncharacterized protein n=1 Tax=Geodermatophilus nigrescens TaxID=1070870 RepID=A0A1M5EH67_9ACTN|nr:hypothetical protein [Geodermatophilus nigrescens]SHF78569.1 hypothetical protein SAMN05444351_0792 [Geodermatophilus nigrescens]
MRTVRVLVVAGTAGLLALAPGVAAAAPGGCQAFGANVSTLAQALGSQFGATASGVASSAPGAFPTLVVRPEQARFCGTG